MKQYPIVDGIVQFLGSFTWSLCWGLIIALIVLTDSSADDLNKGGIVLAMTFGVASAAALYPLSEPDNRAVRLCGAAVGTLALLILCLGVIPEAA